MIVTFDNSFLCALFSEKVRILSDLPDSPTAIRRRRQLRHLFDKLSETSSRILIPTPALSELLMVPGIDLTKVLERIDREATFQVRPFDQKAAVEMARMSIPGTDGKKRKGQKGDWAKVKFDRQIVAIAKTNESEELFSSDKALSKLARACEITVRTFDDLPDPPPENRELFESAEKSE